eukprot:scaffold260557_cov41-Tisochrysis_lutea.AAC.1
MHNPPADKPKGGGRGGGGAGTGGGGSGTTCAGRCIPRMKAAESAWTVYKFKTDSSRKRAGSSCKMQ